MDMLYRIYAGVFGLLIGSFLNVVIYRLPLGKDLVLTRSACRSCGYLIPWWLNIPVLSWIYLRGKCANCGDKIHWRYPVIELVTGLVAYLSFPLKVDTVSFFQWSFQFSIFCVLMSHFVIDLDHKLLLDKLNLYLLALVLPYVLFFYPIKWWLIGGAVGFLGPLLVSWAFYKLKGKVGLGGGDIKLWGVLGVLLGPFGIMENIFLSCLVGSFVGLGLILLKKYDSENGIAFGPFIITAALAQIYFPDWVAVFSITI